MISLFHLTEDDRKELAHVIGSGISETIINADQETMFYRIVEALEAGNVIVIDLVPFRE